MSVANMLRAARDLYDAATETLDTLGGVEVSYDFINHNWDRVLDAYDATRPDTLRELLPWLAERQPFRCEEGPCWGRLDAARAFASDGHGILIVHSPDAPMPCRDGAVWEEGPRSVLSVVGEISGTTVTAPSAGVVQQTVAAIARHSSGPGPSVRVGRVVLSAKLVRAWVGFAAEIAPGDLEITYGDEASAVRFRGPGWEALVMPQRVDDDVRAAAHPLKETP